MSEINDIKQALRDVDYLPWKYTELGRTIEYDAIQNANGYTIVGISSYMQENVDFIILAVNNISSLITTIESHEKELDQQEDKWKELLRVRISSDNTKIWKLEDEVKAKNALIESQKETIDDQYMTISTANIWNSKLKDELESLKAITELAVKWLEEIASGGLTAESTVVIAVSALSEIERLQNGTP